MERKRQAVAAKTVSLLMGLGICLAMLGCPPPRAVYQFEVIPPGETITPEAVEAMGQARRIDELIRSLNYQPDPEVRARAALYLGLVGEARAVEPLAAILDNDPSLDVRLTAATALWMRNDRRAVEPLIRAMKDKAPELRAQAALGLGQLGDARAVEPLLKALRDEAPAVRSQAAAALVFFDDARIVPALIEALGDRNGEVTVWVGAALRDIGRPAQEPLYAALLSDQAQVRSGAASILGEIGDTQAIDKLIPLLSDPDGRVSRTAAEALKKLRPE